MSRLFCFAFIVFLAFHVSLTHAQGTAGAPTPNSVTSAREGLKLAEAGRCQEALPALKRTFHRLEDQKLKRQAGLAGVRCAMTLGQPDSATDFISMLSRDFPRDPEVLYVLVHAYSDLSTLEAQHLARYAASSDQAHELSAEAFEEQGKWELAVAEYRAILSQHPEAPGIHFRLGRLLLSRPNPPADVAEQARKEFQAELKIDPSNGGAEYVLGELARQEQDWDDAIQHFARASKLEPGFGDAFLGLGESLVGAKKFSEAIPPLEAAVKLEPANPAAHYNLAIAYARSGRKQDGDREFEIQRRLTQKGAAGEPAADAQQDPN
jgi:tetratricopeptide (TPR) repeat protein